MTRSLFNQMPKYEGPVFGRFLTVPEMLIEEGHRHFDNSTAYFYQGWIDHANGSLRKARSKYIKAAGLLMGLR